MRLDNVKDETGLRFVRRPSTCWNRKKFRSSPPSGSARIRRERIAMNPHCLTQSSMQQNRRVQPPYAYGTHAVYFSVKFRAEVLKSWYHRNLNRNQKNHCIQVWYVSPRSEQNKSIYRAIDMLIGARFSPWSLIPHENYRGVRLAREAPLE